MEHALPRTWSLCMTSENHGTVGPAGCKFTHAPDKHERVLVVEVPAAAGAPADQINLRLVGAREDLPVAEFEGYVDGEPLVRWMDRDNMPRVGAKLYAAPVAAQAGPAATTELQVRRATDELSLPELAEQFAAVEALGCDYTLSASICGKLFRAMTTPLDCASSQAVVPDEQLEWSHDLQERLIAAAQEFDEHESVRQVMAEAACLLAALTGVQAPTSGSQNG